MRARELFGPTDTFPHRHLGPREVEVAAMLEAIEAPSLAALVDETIPASIRMEGSLRLDPPAGEEESLARLRTIASKNRVVRSLIGLGYADCITPPVIQRNILENPGWYTQYTPYQAEIAQGRMEALVNFQTAVSDLTALPLANASLLDEATAAAEAMAMCAALTRHKKTGFFVSADCHPQVIAVIHTRAAPMGIHVHVGPPEEADFEGQDLFGILLAYPASDGRVVDPTAHIERAHAGGALAVVATDLLALTLLKPPGELGADIAVGSAQRFGVPLGAGGPHAAFLATKEAHKRVVPGRIIGVSKDARGKKAYRLALQTREQHIRRDKATSNICTAQVLLAVMAGAYAVYHGPRGLTRIAQRTHALARVFAEGMRRLGYAIVHETFFDTVRLAPRDGVDLVRVALDAGFNIRAFEQGGAGVAFDERSSADEVRALLEVFAAALGQKAPAVEALGDEVEIAAPAGLERNTPFLEHEVFERYHAEHEMLRYLARLEAKDLSLTHSMIPLGSCTMKLNATSEMLPVSWPELSRIHPFAPADQQRGYEEMFGQLQTWLAEITGFSAVSLQPNAGSQGEYTGLLVIRAYHHARGDTQRTVCLIPTSAHGTNPASAVMAGMKVVPVKCDEAGNIDLADLEAKAEQHRDTLAAMMITYPSTHGVFERDVQKACALVKDRGGRVYLDGANMNAQVGLARPGDFGADVCHLNLHKTFCIPHGGGGPGMGPIGVVEDLAPFLPGHPLRPADSLQAIGPVAAAPFGSPSILPISWMYIEMMGAEGLVEASQIAILNANYLARRLAEGGYEILYAGQGGRVAHEFILDTRPFKRSAGVEVDDIAKRLMDFGYHAPTMSWPVAGTMMIEPTESESKAELDRFCDALLAIREEIRAIESGAMDPHDNPLKNAPHTAEAVTDPEWSRPYSTAQAAFPAPWVRERKFWPAASRVDNAYGDRHLVCTCPPMSEFE